MTGCSEKVFFIKLFVERDLLLPAGQRCCTKVLVGESGGGSACEAFAANGC